MNQSKLEQLFKDVQEIKLRNKKVEIDKAWEKSNTRRFLVAIFTYLSIGFYFQIIAINKPWQNAITPTAAFLLSTLSLPYFKKIWQKHIRK